MNMKVTNRTVNYFLMSLVVATLISTYISFNSPKSNTNLDNTITRHIRTSYQNHTSLQHIQVYSHNGHVRLVGHVANEGQARLALQLAQGAPGVKEIKHELV